MTTAGTTPAKAPFAQYDVRATVAALIAARGNNAEAATALGISTRAIQWRVGRLDTDERKRLDALAVAEGWPTAEARKVAGLAKARSVGGLQALMVSKEAYAFVDTAPLGVVEELHRRTSARLEAERAAATPRAVPLDVAGGVIVSRQGPSLRLAAYCHGCAHEVSEYYCIEDGNDVDSGHNVYCAHTAPRRHIGDTRWETPKWCPLMADAVAKFLTETGESLPQPHSAAAGSAVTAGDPAQT